MKDPITLLLRLFGYKYNTRNSLLLNHMMETTHGNWHTRMFNNGGIEKYRYSLYSN
jgi:hypothetical protein